MKIALGGLPSVFKRTFKNALAPCALGLCLTLSPLAPPLSAAPPALDFFSAGESSSIARELLARMGDEEVVGQLFMISYPGARPDKAFLDSLSRRHIGGIKIFGWNAKDEAVLAESVGLLQSTALATKGGIPLLVATDQEGGWIRHVGGRTSMSPGNMALGASGFAVDAYRSGQIIGRELAALGINMNFAPTVDVATNLKSWVIGSRAFSSDPLLVGSLGSAYARGSMKSRVIPTAKHYPGHGDTQSDSHTSLPVINVDWDTLWSRELLPYRMMAADGVPAIMSGHLAFPRLTKNLEPASLSAYFLKDVLRGKIGFRGVIVTDDLCMSGATDYAGSVAQAAVLALASGNDILMFSSADEPAWRLVLERYRADARFREACRESALRILTLKLDYLRGEGAVSLKPRVEALPKQLPDPEAKDAFLSQAARAISYLKKGDLPLKEGGKILLAGPFSDFFETGLAHYPQAASYRFGFQSPRDQRQVEIKELQAAIRGVDTVIICVANDTSILLLDALKDSGKRVVVLSVLSPAQLRSYSWPNAVVAAYSYSRQSFAAAFSVIRGDIQAQGILPISGP